MVFRKGFLGIFLSIFLLFPLTIAGQTGREVIFSSSSEGGLTSFKTGEDFIEINYVLPSVSLIGTRNAYGDFFRVSATDHGRVTNPGKPELIQLSRLIYIPEGAKPIIRISDVKSTLLRPSRLKVKGLLYPRQPDAVKSQQTGRSDFIIDRTLYGRRGLIESDTVSIEYLGKVRGRQLATLLVTPMRYNPYDNEIEVITSMKIEILFSSSANKSESSTAISSPMSELMSKSVLNWNSSDFITGYSDRPVGMIILTDTTFSTFISPLVKWKTKKGFDVKTLYWGTGRAGASFTEVKDSIKKIYNNISGDKIPPEYLLIIGDVARIPLSEGSSQVTDLYYGEFDGNGDYLPDMYIGRIPAADTNEVKSVVNKIVQYESFQFADTNRFYDRALVTGGNDAGYATYMNGQVNYAINNYIRPSNQVEDFYFRYPQAATAEDSIKKLINGGLSFINYSGHGEISGWVDPTIKLTKPSGQPTWELPSWFANKSMYPFVISNACQTAHFNVRESFGNKMLVSSEKGAIGFIGCSNDSYWDEDFFWAIGASAITENPTYAQSGLGAYDRLFHINGEKPSDWYISAGQINYAGNMAVSAGVTSRKKYYWETYNVIGDPSLIPFIGTPGQFGFSLPDTLPQGIRSLSLTIEPFAYIAISRNDTLLDAAHASPSGAVVLDLPDTFNDSCLFVVTAQNRIPLIKYVPFRPVAKEYLNLAGVLVNDPDGDSNGRADFGESAFIALKISNLGLSAAAQVYAKINTDSDLISIISDSVFIGNMAPLSDALINNSLAFRVNELIPDKSFATINIQIKDAATVKNYKRDIALHAPVLEIINCLIDDSGTGNNDLTADPGETIKLVFYVSNSGSSNTSGMFSIVNTPPGVTINQPSVKSGNLNYGTIKEIPVTLIISPTLLRGSSIEINALLYSEPYQLSKTFSIPIGKTRESFEFQNFRVFPWQNNSVSPWIITGTQPFEGYYAARSGIIGHNSESVLRLPVNVPVKDSMSFRYKVSSEQNYDYLIFRLNGKQNFRVSGETDWTEKKIELEEGLNFLEWVYKKDESVSSGSDCGWLDLLSFPPSAFNRVDIKTRRITSPKPNDSYSKEKIAAEIINFGYDTLQSFNLAYTINQGSAVTQQFNTTLIPGDTAVVTFTEEANMSGNGTYLIEVYSFGNNDSFLLNDTISMFVVDTLPEIDIINRLVVMPNPFSDTFRAMFNAPDQQDIRITIIDSTGRIFWDEMRTATEGINILSLSPQSLRQGFYTLRIRGRSINKTARIIKS